MACFCHNSIFSSNCFDSFHVQWNSIPKFTNWEFSSTCSYNKKAILINSIRVTSLPLSRLRSYSKVSGDSKPLEKWRSKAENNPSEEMEYEEIVKQHTKKEKEESESFKELDQEIKHSLADYKLEDVKEARSTVGALVLAGEKVEQMIADLGQAGKLTDVLLLVIKGRLAIARHDKDEDAILCLDLLYKRIETERYSRSATPSMKLLNELLHLHDGGSDRAWLRRASQVMRNAFVPEDPSIVFLNAGGSPQQDDNDVGGSRVYRIDFIVEVDELLSQVKAMTPLEAPNGSDAASVAEKLRHSERIRAISQVKQLKELAISLY